jgi:hypothetical protein
LRDSLRFNLVFGRNPDGYIDSLASASLQVVAEQEGDNNSPTHWSCVSHYTLWEAEGFPGSNFNLQYNGGSLVDDPDASGGKARRFTAAGTPGLIQWGPTYHQERGDIISYTAEFRLKFHYLLSQPRGARGTEPPPTTPVCRIKVVDRGNILKDSILCKSDFPEGGFGGYKTFKLVYTVPDGDTVDFQIERFTFSVTWSFYIDYVKVYDQNGWDLIENPTHYVANQIKAYVDSPWVHTTIPETGDTVVYRWLMRDQLGYIDCYKPYAYIDSLLRNSLPHIPGAQFTCHYYSGNINLIHDYLIRSQPVEYMVDYYPFNADDTTESNIQQVKPKKMVLIR